MTNSRKSFQAAERSLFDKSSNHGGPDSDNGSRADSGIGSVETLQHSCFEGFEQETISATMSPRNQVLLVPVLVLKPGVVFSRWLEHVIHGPELACGTLRGLFMSICLRTNAYPPVQSVSCSSLTR